IGWGRAFSDPLTILIRPKDPTLFIDYLIHELIHQIFIQKDNYRHSKQAWEYINKTYHQESQITRNHIPLHAIHTQIYKTFYGEERLQRDINQAKEIGATDYIQAWN